MYGHVSPRTIARYDFAWKLNAQLFLRHPEHTVVKREHNSIISIICTTFPSPEWDNKKHFITKAQRNHDKYFIEAMCTSFVLCSMSPACDRKKAPSEPKKLAEHNAFLPIQDERCERASRCIHHMCVEMGKRLTHYRQKEHHNHDHKELVFEQHNYVHYVRVLSELKAKCGAKGGVVVSWRALHGGKRPRMFLPHFLLMQEFIHTTPQLSDCASQMLQYVQDDMNNVIYNDSPQEITLVRQLIEAAANHGEQLPSD